MIKKFFVVLFIICSVWGGDIVVSNDKEYYIYEDNSIKIIFAKEYKKHIKTIIELSKKINNNYSTSFGFRLNKKLTITLASSKNQIINAFATPILNDLVMMYGSGSVMGDYFSSKSWLKTLLVHEISHIYQMEAKKEQVSKTLNKTLGNNFMPIFPLVPIPLFTFPNILLPTLTVEGNAVLNESRFNNGGRLYSGRARALFYTLLKDNKLNYTRLRNDHLLFPFTEEKYIVGGYFMAYLSLKYGVDKVNRFFITHSKHYINPFLISSSFVDTFHITYKMAVEEFLNFFRKEADNLQELNGKILDTALSYGGINKVDGKIFISYSNLKERTKILTYNNSTTIKQDRWLLGKPFLINKQLYTLSSYNYLDKIEFGLYDKNIHQKANTGSKYILDIKGDDYLYFDLKDSFDEAKLYLNNHFIDYISSNAIMDKDKNIYYFKQNKNSRVLYKNQKQLFSIGGYYGFVVDVIEDTIYFIANSRYGSTLYSFSKNQIQRLSSADNIIDAKMINKKPILPSKKELGENTRSRSAKLRIVERVYG